MRIGSRFAMCNKNRTQVRTMRRGGITVGSDMLKSDHSADMRELILMLSFISDLD
jgi:hypothetical protein